MLIENELNQKKLRTLVLKELVFGRISSIVILGLYFLIWKILYSIAKVGQLKTNIPLLLGVVSLFLMMVIEICIIFQKYMKNTLLYRNMGQITINNIQLLIESKDVQDSIIYTWDRLVKIRENKKFYFLYFKDNCFLPIIKKSEQSSHNEELRKLLGINKPIKKTYIKWVVLIFVLVTAVGIYEVGSCAVNFNGDLSWKINELKTDKKVKLKEDNFYTSKLEGIIASVKDKVKMEQKLMTNSLDIRFSPDGTIKSIETYIYGYDENLKLKTGYLLYYDKSKGNKLTVHTQNWGEGGSTVYDPNNDLSIVINILNQIPIVDDVKQWHEKEFAVLYKGIRNWGYNLEGIRYIDAKGIVTIPKVVKEEIVGPSISLYCPEKEGEIIPYRFVYKK